MIARALSPLRWRRRDRRAPRQRHAGKGAGACLAMLPAFVGLARGDLVFGPAMSGSCRAPQLLHANGHFMEVTSEPLAIADARITAKTGPVSPRSAARSLGQDIKSSNCHERQFTGWLKRQRNGMVCCDGGQTDDAAYSQVLFPVHRKHGPVGARMKASCARKGQAGSRLLRRKPAERRRQSLRLEDPCRAWLSR